MNQQEIDRVLGEYGSVVLSREEFAQAAAEIRRQALEEAADVCADIVADCDASTRHVAMAAGAIRCEDAIRALAQSNGETEHG